MEVSAAIRTLLAVRSYQDKPVPGAKMPELEIIDLASLLSRSLEAGKP